MIHSLVMTKEGMLPIEDVKEGMEVYSLGEWKKAPKPIKGLCTKCTFETLPTCIFEKQFTIHKKYVSVNHKIKLATDKPLKDELVVRGYFKENCYGNGLKPILIPVKDGVRYWYSKFVRLYNQVGNFTASETSIAFYFDKSRIGPLTVDDFSERNLEYYLEGMLRKSFSYYYDSLLTVGNINSLTEDDRLVLRLLGIDITSRKITGLYFAVVRNEIALLSHIKDTYNKSRVKHSAIIMALKNNSELPEYTGNEYKILKKEPCEGWMLPGINPDINGINPCSNNVRTYIGESFLKKGEIKDNFYDKFFN